MTKNFPKDLEQKLEENGVLAVLEINNVKDAVPTAQALVAGGITAIELALRTPAAEEAIKEIVANVPEMMVGVGTVLRVEQAQRIKTLGAKFGLAPGYNPKVVKEAQALDLPFAPGVATASELEGALELGCNVIKFFPAGPLGGVKYFNSCTAPYNYLNSRYIPLGGVNLENLESWAKNPKVLTVGGTWIAKSNLIESGNFDQITKNASEAVKLWKTYRG